MKPEPSFPPLFTGAPTPDGHTPFAAACALAAQGCDGGTITHAVTADRVSAAMVFAPEVPLAEAMTMLIVCGIGLQNAIGALAPPEVGVHLHWDGRLRLNGGLAGGLEVASDATDPAALPGWLVIGFWLRLIPDNPDETGATPDQTSLFDEGCSEIDPITLIEAWSRHTLVWLNRWEEEGAAPLNAEWTGIAWDHGKEIAQVLPGDGRTGTFLGVDERFGMLFKTSDGTQSIPLTALLR